MDVRFEDKKLELIETPRAAETGLPFGVIVAARSRLNIVRAAPDESTLLKWKSLRYEKHSGPGGVNGRVHLTGEWRLNLSLLTSQAPNVAVVINATNNA